VAEQDSLLRIGELSRRVGVPVESLRAWERRYGLLRPNRTQGGFRLYSEDDLKRVLAMRAGLESGLSAAQAATAALAVERERPAPLLPKALDELTDALDRFDEVAAQSVLDELVSTLTLDAVLRAVLIPYLHELGERWERGQVSVAQEHFASNVVRGRLMSLARGWDRGAGRRALLACTEGEEHDLPLIMLGLALRTHTWRIGYLGANTPIESLADAIREVRPDAVVVSGTVQSVFGPQTARLRKCAAGAPLYLAGSAATDQHARRAGATLLEGDPLAAADELTRRHAKGAAP
jgi:DNA-binding transcriptional MerR regulator